MRTSVMPSFTKNVRSLAGRRRLATLAATVVLAGGVQLMTADASWACEGGTAPAEAKPVTPAAAHHGDLAAGFHMTPDHQSITAGGAKAEVGVEVANFTGAPYENVAPTISIFNEKGATQLEDFTIEAATGGGWKKLSLRHGCDPAIIADTSSLKAKKLNDGRAENFLFRISVSANAAADLKDFTVFVGGKADGYPSESGGSHSYAVVRTAAPAKPATPAKPSAKATTAAKPAAPKPTAPATAKAAPARPAADQAPAAAPSAAPSAPATTAPAGTPELAQTGSSSTNGFLAASAAAFVALGAGVLIAVRRLRPQR
ncbi:LPXTG cell wall anchor domain-containing protein [Kitasatospora sp. NPDC003701]